MATPPISNKPPTEVPQVSILKANNDPLVEGSELQNTVFHNTGKGREIAGDLTMGLANMASLPAQLVGAALGVSLGGLVGKIFGNKNDPSAVAKGAAEGTRLFTTLASISVLPLTLISLAFGFASQALKGAPMSGALKNANGFTAKWLKDLEAPAMNVERPIVEVPYHRITPTRPNMDKAILSIFTKGKPSEQWEIMTSDEFVRKGTFNSSKNENESGRIIGAFAVFENLGIQELADIPFKDIVEIKNAEGRVVFPVDEKSAVDTDLPQIKNESAENKQQLRLYEYHMSLLKTMKAGFVLDVITAGQLKTIKFVELKLNPNELVGFDTNNKKVRIDVARIQDVVIKPK